MLKKLNRIDTIGKRCMSSFKTRANIILNKVNRF